MTDAPYISARKIALNVLDSFKTNQCDAAEILHAIIDRTDQKGQATDIVFGVIRNRPLLDHLITTIASVSQKATKPALLNILRIGTYELVFAPDTAHYAIVNEAVKLAGSSGAKQQTGFVNAVLRNILRAIETRKVQLDGSDASRTIPTSTETGCLFKRDILPNPQTDLAEYLTKAFSLPAFLVEEWLIEFGPDTAHEICFAQNRKPGIYLRPNSLKTTLPEFVETITYAGVETLAQPDGNVLKLISHLPITAIPGFKDGHFTIQDPTAAKVAAFLDPRPGQTILDLCSAPGGKTTHLAELMQNEGTIIATDINAERLVRVDENCARLGINIAKTVAYNDLDKTLAALDSIDTILLDVPCSNSGVLSRRAEARLRITPKAIRDITRTQIAILQRAADIIKPNAIICYSTCSICKAEDRDLIDSFLAQDSRFTFIKDELTLPAISPQGFDNDGGYIAIIKKISDQDIGEL